jgi:hypothetical protein
MENFDLKKYLAEGKLLKEDREAEEMAVGMPPRRGSEKDKRAQKKAEMEQAERDYFSGKMSKEEFNELVFGDERKASSKENDIKKYDSDIENETGEDKLKALETDDYQKRKGGYPRDGVADTIIYWDHSLSFDFKNTDERTAERWTKNFLSNKNLKPKKTSVEQTGDYNDDWVTVTAYFK